MHNVVLFYRHHAMATIRTIVILSGALILHSCASSVRFTSAGGIDYRLLGTHKTTNSVTLETRNRSLTPQEAPADATRVSRTETTLKPTTARFTGIASYYGDEFHGRKTANGERFDQNDFSAAHRTLPFGTMLRVRYLQTDRSVIVRVNDRGPFKENRVLDLSKAAAEELGLVREGTGTVEVVVMQ